MTRGKRRLLITAIVLTPLAVVICLWLFYDCPPPDDADLRIEYEDIPDDENGFTYLDRAAEALEWPEAILGDTVDTVRLLNEGRLDAENMKEVIDANEAVFGFVRQAVTCPRFQVPEVKDYGTGLDYLRPMRQVGLLGRIRAELLFRQGQDRDAFEQAMCVVRLGHQMEGGRGTFTHYLTGLAVKSNGLRQMRSMLRTTSLEADQLRRYARRLCELGACEGGLADAYRVEYRCCAHAVDDVSKGTGFFSLLLRAWLPLRFMPLKPNKTKRLLVGRFEALVQASTRPCIEDQSLPLDRPRYGTAFWARAFLSGNGKGIVLYHQLMSTTLTHSLRVKYRGNCHVAATVILVALRCHKLEHGQLPETLDALVPEYFEAVPLDDFDGKPMKYSRDKRVVYAVGRDLVDNGGIEGREGFDDEGYDLIYKIEF